MKKILFSFSLLLICFGCINVSAIEECTTSELNRLKELANNVSFQYEYEIENVKFTANDEDTYQEVSYTITAINLPNDVFVNIVNDPENRRFTADNSVISNFFNGERVRLEFIAYTANLCSGNLLLTKTLNLPFFNLYSLRDECLEYPDFEYCSQTGNYNITNADFLEALEEYKNNLQEEEPNQIIENKSFLEKYYIYILIVVLVIILVIVFLIIKKKRDKNGRDL